jgi:MFS family permease
MALTLLRKDKPKATNIRFDIAGTLTSTAGLLSLILGLSLIAKLGLQSPIICTLITAGLLFLALFIYVERKAEDATVDLSLFKNRTFSGAMVSLLFYWMAVQGLALTSPFYLMEGRSMAASYVGILFTVGTITSLLISPLSGSLSDRFGALSLSAIGGGIGLVAFSFWLSFSPQTPIFLIVLALIVGGVAGGTYLTANGSAIMGSVRPEQRGSASALMMSMTGLSLSLGMTWSGTVYSMRRVFHQAELTRQGLGQTLRPINPSISPFTMLSSYPWLFKLWWWYSHSFPE